MSSMLARLSLPLLVVAAVACGESPSPAGDNPGAGMGAGGTSGAAAPGGASTGGSSGASQGGTAGSTAGVAGGAGQDPGSGAGPGGAAGSGAPGGAAGDGAGQGGTTSGAGAGGAGTGGTVGGSSGLAGAGMGGVGSGDMYATGVTVTVHPEVRTILVVNWTQAVAAENVYLEFTFETGNVMTSRAKPGTVGMKRDVALGIPASTATTIRVVSRAGGVDYKTRDYMGTTGAIPTGMPVPTVSMYNAQLASPDRWMFGAVENSDGGCNNQDCFYHAVFWLYIMDRRGRIVWYYSDAGSNATPSFQRMARDGEYIWIEKRPFGGSGTRNVLKRTLDGYYSETIPVSVADAIDVTDDGSLLYDANNTLRERTRAGMTRDIWSCRSAFPSPASCYTNTINWNPRDNTVLMSYPDRDTVVEISRATGQMVGQYGMGSGSYAFATSPAPPPPETTWQFGFQHFANITKDGTLMVSSHLDAAQNTSQPVAGQHAFMEFSIDRTNRRLTNVWYYNDGPEWAMYKGMAIKLPNNNYLANYGTGGVIREITPSKQTVFMVKFDAPAGEAGNDFFNKMVGHNELLDDLYKLNGGGPTP